MKLVIVRHGQSEWNKKNLFCGWTDVELSEQGVEEAKQAGQKIKNSGIKFDVAFTSYLKRANKTLDYVLDELGQDLPIKKSWRLNERHYGALQGLNKDETRAKYGDEQVHLWRRSADTRPPALDPEDERAPIHDPLYNGVDSNLLPLHENLLDTCKRLEPYFEAEIRPVLLAGKNVLISAHGNSLRALRYILEGLTPEEIIKIEIPTGQPFVYELDENLKILSQKYL